MRSQARFLAVALSAALLPALLHPATGLAQRRVLPTQAAAPASEPPIALASPEQPIRFGLTLPLRNQSALQQLLRDQRDPGSPRFRQFLSAPQFTADYGPTQADYDRVLAFARAQGFQIVRTFSNRLLVDVAALPASINKAFAVTMQVHQHPTKARTYYAPDVEPTVQSTVPILSVVGISTRDLPHPMLVHGNTVRGSTTGSGQGGEFLGSDMRAAYAGGVAATGEGQTVGLIEYGPYNLSDVNAYFNAVHQPRSVPIYNVLLDVDGVCSGTPSTGGCDDGEEVIDMQQAISMAPALSGLIIYETYGSGDGLTPFAQAASDNVAKQLSLSFGFGGTPATQPGYEQVFMELAAQGQNLFIASGDGGAFPNGGGYPGNSPNVTDVGGTDLVTAGPGGPWQSETAWIGSGGGFNPQSPIPAYQASAINHVNAGSPSFRNVPDVSMEANTDNFFCANGSCTTGIGGTSLAAPRWAGFLALVNEQANGRSVGFVNPAFYSLGQTSSYSTVFHDITVGNNFNASSPDLFQAVPGYDLTSGWGTPNGQFMLDSLAPPLAASAPNFALAASPATLNLTPGASGTATLTLTLNGGFAGAIELQAALIGAPAGVTAALGSSTLDGAGQTTITVSTTAGTPGGTYLVAITGSSNGLSHTAYLSLALPDFSLSASSTAVYLNQQGSAQDLLAVNAINGFSGNLNFSLGALPPGIAASLAPQTTNSLSRLTLNADVLAPTSSGRELSVTGASGSTVRAVPALSLAVSAAASSCGLGDLVDLSHLYNVTAIHSDGRAFTDGGVGGGYAYSNAQLGPARVLNGIRFQFGAPDLPNAVAAAGQTIALPQGRYNALQLLGAGINGTQSGQTLLVTYTDGTTAQFTQSFSDWFAPGTNPDENEAVASAYRNLASGVPDDRQFNVYGYTLVLDPSKIVKGLTLPANPNVLVLAATLSLQEFGREVNLAKVYNVTGIYTDGSTFDPAGGLDAGGAAYSANRLGDTAASGRDVVVGPTHFHLAGSNQPDAVYAAGQTIPVPVGFYANLELLGTGVQGDQLDQPIQINYADGSSQTFTQTFSDWSTLGSYANESIAIGTAYRDYNDGTEDQQTFNVYLYTLKLQPLRAIRSITLPNNRNVLILSVSLAPPSIFELEPIVCRVLGLP